MTLMPPLPVPAAAVTGNPLAPWQGADRYRVLFDSIDEGFCVIQMLYAADGTPVDYRFVETNPSFERQTGLRDAIGRTVREMVPAHEDHWYRIYGEVARTGEPTRFEARADALQRWYDVYAFRIGGADEQLVAVLFKDVLPRKRAEQALREADRHKDEFIAILAHELRNPLAPLRTGLHIMKLAGTDAATMARVQPMMERQVEHLVRLVDDLLDVSRISRGLVTIQPQRVDLVHVVRQALEEADPAIRERRHELVLQMPPGPVPVDADTTRMAQAITNLLTNAVKYTPSGGRVSVTLRQELGEAVLSVADNGVGIEESMLERVFGLFTQADAGRPESRGGLGIGLALVQRLVELHGGSVQAESAGLGCGSCFTLRLPLASGLPPALADAIDATQGLLAQERLRMLVADDNVDAATSLATMLQLLGHEVHTVHDGLSAVDAARRFRPHVVLLDVAMPGLDGLAAARRLRALPDGDAFLLVAVTGWGQDEHRAATRAAGFDHHLVKPIALQDLRGVFADAAKDDGPGAAA